MAIVSPEVADALRNSAPARLAVFTASCAERMAQLFTGLRGDVTEREPDVQTFLDILDELWDVDLASDGFAARVSALEAFPELDTDEDDHEDFSTVDDNYSFEAVLCLHQAVVYRATGDAEEAVRCADATLSALWQLDRNIPEPRHFDEEHEYQRRTALGALASPAQVRAADREVGLDRLLVVRSRLVGG